MTGYIFASSLWSDDSSPIRLARGRSDTFPLPFHSLDSGTSCPVGSRGHGGMLTASSEARPPASGMNHPFIKSEACSLMLAAVLSFVLPRKRGLICNGTI